MLLLLEKPADGIQEYMLICLKSQNGLSPLPDPQVKKKMGWPIKGML